jgi:tripartite-type tricarboxylate transporter receptor subunit TctC
MKTTPHTPPAIIALAGLLCAWAPLLVLAQAYPTKPVRGVIAFGPGGSSQPGFAEYVK